MGEKLFCVDNIYILGQTATPAPQPGQQLPYEVVIHQTPAYVTSIYIGNLPPNISRKVYRL